MTIASTAKWIYSRNGLYGFYRVCDSLLRYISSDAGSDAPDWAECISDGLYGIWRGFDQGVFCGAEMMHFLHPIESFLLEICQVAFSNQVVNFVSAQ